MTLSGKIFVIVSLFFSLSLGAGETKELSDLLSEVREHNPDIRAAGYRTDAARARIPQLKGWEDPEIGLMLDGIPSDSVDLSLRESTRYRFEQKVPFPGKKFVLGRKGGQEALRVGEESRAHVLDILFDVKETFYDLYRTNRSLAINRELQTLYRQLRESAKTAYAAGQTTAEPPLKAEVELSRLENEAIRLEQERRTHNSHMVALLNRPSHDPIEIPDRIDFPETFPSEGELTEKIFASRPEIRKAAAAVQGEKYGVTSAWQGLLPDFSLRLDYEQRRDATDAVTGMAMVNVPIWFWGKNRGEIREAKALLHVAELERESIKVHTRHQLEEAHTNLLAGEEIVEKYAARILPSARANLKAARLAYRLGKADFLTLVDAARAYYDLSLDSFRAEGDFGMAIAHLERLVGEDFTNQGDKP